MYVCNAEIILAQSFVRDNISHFNAQIFYEKFSVPLRAAQDLFITYTILHFSAHLQHFSETLGKILKNISRNILPS